MSRLHVGSLGFMRVLLHRADRATIDSGTNYASVIQRRPSTRLLLVTHVPVRQMRNLERAHVRAATTHWPLIWIVRRIARPLPMRRDAPRDRHRARASHTADIPEGNQQRAVRSTSFASVG